MDTVTFYTPHTGRIAFQYSGTRLAAMEELHQGSSHIDGIHNGDTHYILDGEVTERPTSPVNRTDLTLLDVPEGSKLFINGESYDAEGTVEMEFPLSGTYKLRVECFPYLDWSDEVTV